MWVPWIRTTEDSRNFVREFFWVYAEPTSRYLIETTSQTTLPRPWEGKIRLEARDGSELITTYAETIRVQFDHSARFRMELGPEDPRQLWPEPPHDERFELPEGIPPGFGGSELDLTSGRGGSEGTSSSLSSEITSSNLTSSDITSSVITSSDLTSSNLTSSSITSSDLTSSDLTSSHLMSSKFSFFWKWQQSLWKLVVRFFF